MMTYMYMCMYRTRIWLYCTPLAESIFSLIPLGAADGGVSLSALGVLGRDARVASDGILAHGSSRSIFFSVFTVARRRVAFLFAALCVLWSRADLVRTSISPFLYQAIICTTPPTPHLSVNSRSRLTTTTPARSSPVRCRDSNRSGQFTNTAMAKQVRKPDNTRTRFTKMSGAPRQCVSDGSRVLAHGLAVSPLESSAQAARKRSASNMNLRLT